MKRIIILSTCILFLLGINAFPQDVEKSSIYRNQVGIQFNPIINERLLSPGGFGLIETVSSVRYGYRITKNVTTGFELVCRFPILTGSSYREQSELFNYFVYRIGLVTRYSFLTDKRFQIFAEVSPYFAHAYREVLSSVDPTPYRNDSFGCYAAPGVTWYSKSRRVSFDLYAEFLLSGHISLSNKVNFSF